MPEPKYSVTIRSDGNETTRVDDDNLHVAMAEALIGHTGYAMVSKMELLARVIDYIRGCGDDDCWFAFDTVRPILGLMLDAATEAVAEIERIRKSS